MEAVQPKPIAAKKHELRTGEAYLAGRIKFRSKVSADGRQLVLTVLTLPALDQYSSPATVEVQSFEALGQVGEEWAGVVQVGGVQNNFNTKPDEHGEFRKVQSARNRLTVVEIK